MVVLVITLPGGFGGRVDYEKYQAISAGDTNIERVAVEEKDADSSSLVFELRVRNREHLARVVKVIRRMPEVLKVTRTIASHGRTRATE